MSTSKLQSVVALIASQIVAPTTSIVHCTLEFGGLSATSPWAEVFAVEGEPNTAKYSVNDEAMRLIVVIHGSSNEQVQLANEEITPLWLKPHARVTALAALGVIIPPQPGHWGKNAIMSGGVLQHIELVRDFSFTLRFAL